MPDTAAGMSYFSDLFYFHKFLPPLLYYTTRSSLHVNSNNGFFLFATKKSYIFYIK